MINPLFNKIRKQGFWTLDSLKGGQVKKNYREIKQIQEDYFSPVSQKLREKYLYNLLQHTIRTVPYYKDIPLSSRLQDFPVISKTEIQKDLGRFTSSKFDIKKSFKVATSGSTGVPFILYQNKGKKIRNTADTLYFLASGNYEIGEKLYDLEVWRQIGMSSPFITRMKNLEYVDITQFTDKAITDFLQTLKAVSQPQHLIGFVTAFEQICKYLDTVNSKPLQTSVISIFTISEYLSAESKNKIQYYFQVPVVSRYSSEEVGILAQQEPVYEKSDFKLNLASYHFEILDLQEDKPVAPGTLGRVVITDYFNYCMPLIRYDTGDIASFSNNVHTKLPSFSHIEGRKMDLIYTTCGDLISSFIVYTKFHKYYSLLHQYQFIQQSAKTYVVKLNCKTEFPYEEELISSIKKDFGLDATVLIEYVKEIPALSSGKRKKVVSLLSS